MYGSMGRRVVVGHSFLKEKITQCLKISEKVSFNVASEASYVYILSGQKFIKNTKNGQFWRVFENLKLAVKQCYQTFRNPDSGGQTVLPDRSLLIGKKLVENAKIEIANATL